MAAVGFLPQFAGPGYESALAAGLLLPSAAAITTLLELCRRPVSPWMGFARGSASGALLAASGLLVVMLHGLRVGFCDPLEGLWMYLLGPAVGAVMGGAWGGSCAVFVSRTRLRRKRLWGVLLTLAAPLFSIGISLFRFYSSPMVFAFDPFFGYFSGPLYDTVIDVFWSLSSYRVGSACTLLFAAIFAHKLAFGEGRELIVHWRKQRGLSFLALAALGASIAHSAYGAELGHYSTASSIERALGRRLTGQRCDVIYSSSLLLRDVRLFTRDCDANVKQVERYLGVSGPQQIRVYLFASDYEKGKLMGASHTYIAKPWREEVYVQWQPYPHPVIAHELAHVVAGRFGAGPFKVSGPLGGLIPDPGRIEGIAVAAAPDEDDELSARQWSAAMLKLGFLPSLHSLFRLGFLGQPSSRAYTVAGSFVGWFTEHYGREKLRAWYGGASLPELTGGKDLSALDSDFRSYLGALELPEKSLLTAKARFDRPAFFARDCPRIVDRLVAQAEQSLAVGDWQDAEKHYRKILQLDEHHTGARFGLAGCARKQGNDKRALERYLELAKNPELSKIEQASALEAAGDIHFYARNMAEADPLYESASKLLFDEGRLRTITVKRWAKEGLAHDAVGALLVGDPELGPSWDVAGPLLAALDVKDPTESVGSYLLGRNLLQRGRFAEAKQYLDRALNFPDPLELHFQPEAMRLRLIVDCALDTRDGRSGLDLALLTGRLGESKDRGLLRLAERCGRAAPNPTRERLQP